jgi:D-alanyl-D-alanine carboxypeptidase (penicillin-binding protein 5/6)
MNRRALSLGAVDTHFVNPSGLPASEHVTTAYDMALIMREAVKNPTFTEIISARRFDIPPTERQSETRHLLNSNRQIHPGTYFNESVVGGKTGWTTAAGNTLVSFAREEDRELIVAVLQGEGVGAFSDTTALLDFGFALPMETVKIFDAETYSVTVPVLQEINGNPTEIGRVSLRAENDMEFELPLDWSHSWLRYELSVPETLKPPVLLGETLGRVTVYVQNIRVGEAILTAQENIFAYTPIIEPEEEIFPHEEEIFPHEEIETENYFFTLIIPLAISGVTLLFSCVAVLTRNKRRLRRILKSRRARFARYPHYRYK